MELVNSILFVDKVHPFDLYFCDTCILPCSQSTVRYLYITMFSINSEIWVNGIGIRMKYVVRNGAEWWRLRSEFQHGLSRPQNVRSYLPQTDEIIQEFVNQCKEWPRSADDTDFLVELSRLFLECK